MSPPSASDPQALFAKGAQILSRILQTGDAATIDEAVDLLERALHAAAPDEPDRPMMLSFLGFALHRRFEHAGADADLDRAIEVFEQAVKACPTDTPDATHLVSLGTALQTRFVFTGADADLDRAIELFEQAVKATDSPDPTHLTSLGRALHKRFEHAGADADLDRAIEVGEQAVKAGPINHFNRPGHLTGLGIAFQTRYEHAGAEADLDRAIDLFEQAVTACPADHPGRLEHLTNLGIGLQRRFERAGAEADLDRAIDLFEEVVTATPADHPDRPGHNLGAALLARFERTGAEADLDRAIELVEEVAKATPADHVNRPTHLTSLGSGLQRRFERTGAEADLDRAIRLFEEAVKATPADHPDRPLRLFNLGTGLLTRFLRTGAQADLDRALRVFREATTVIAAPILVRARAARRWGQLATAAGESDETIKAYTTAVRLAGLAVPRGLVRVDQEFRLRELAGLGSEAAAACVQAGQPGRAVELFEQGRAVMFSQILDARSDLTDLEEENPDLAAEFTRCREVLDQPDPRLDEPSTGAGDPAADAQQAAQRRRDAATQFGRVLTEIRALPGFARFLMPRPIAELMQAAAEGPVVLINCAALRSDALILTAPGSTRLSRRAGFQFLPRLRSRSSRVVVLPLPEVTVDAVAEQVSTFLEAVADLYGRRFARPAVEATTAAGVDTPEARLSQVLRWLSDRITGPVLDHLGYTDTPADGTPWPRVWWCPSGALSMLPLHAAGHHNTADGVSDAVIDRVISSTIPTLRALLHARQASPPPPGPPRVLAVAMPHTPDQPDLPGAAREVDTLQQLLAGQVDVLGLPDTGPATYDTVIAALPQHPWVHFACHGDSDLTDPSASHLLLADYQHHPLTVLDLTRTRLEGVEMAFLSACTTARSGDKLPDEPIHLAAACQLAGYRHVIASLWPIGDADTATLTTDFYTALLTAQQSATSPAVALHHATRRLRTHHRDRPSRWAPYTHTGP